MLQVPEGRGARLFQKHFSSFPFLPLNVVSQRGFSRSTPRRPAHLPVPERMTIDELNVLLAYEVIWLSMAKEDGAGRDEANPQQARECTRRRNRLMVKVALTAKKSLGTTTMQKFKASEKLVRNYLS